MYIWLDAVQYMLTEFHIFAIVYIWLHCLFKGSATRGRYAVKSTRKFVTQTFVSRFCSSTACTVFLFLLRISVCLDYYFPVIFCVFFVFLHSLLFFIIFKSDNLANSMCCPCFGGFFLMQDHSAEKVPILLAITKDKPLWFFYF